MFSTRRIPGWGQASRNEFYTILMLVLGAVAFSHTLGYWPHGTGQVAKPPEATQAPSGDPFVNQDLLWRVAYLVSLLAVGGLYYAGRRAGRPTNPDLSQNTASPKVQVKILNGHLGEVPNQQVSGTDVYLLLRVRATASEANVTLNDWRLSLWFGDRQYCVAHRDQRPILFSHLPQEGDGGLPPRICTIKPLAENIRISEPLRKNVEEEVWIVFRTIDMNADRVLGADFHLTAVCVDGNEYKTIKRPDCWLDRVSIIRS